MLWFCAPASNYLFTCSLVCWLDFFQMRLSLDVFGKQCVEAIYLCLPWTLRLPSKHPYLCCSHSSFLPPGVLSGQFLIAMVFICRDVSGRITSPSTAMLRDNDINIWAMDCRTIALGLSAMHSHCSHAVYLLQGTPGTVFSISCSPQVAPSTT